MHHVRTSAYGDPSVMFQNRRAWRLETSSLLLTVLECGGHVAELMHKRNATNPLWIQNRPTIDSDLYDPAIHGGIYGTDGEARLISGLAGHNLCFPYWGYPSQSEQHAGMTAHGETNIRRWELQGYTSDSLVLSVTLPDSLIRFERTIRCAGEVAYFRESAENLSAWDRPVAWCEHVTFGPPFLEARKTGVQATLGRGFRTDDQTFAPFDWPQGFGQIDCDLRAFSSSRHTDLVNSFQVDSQREIAYLAAWNAERRLLVAYLFHPSEFPWMNVWESNDNLRQTRGMEFSNTPVDGTLRKLIKQPTIWGVPTFEWLEAKAVLTKSYAALVTIVPEDFGGVEDIVRCGNQLVVLEPGSIGRIRLDFAAF